MAASVNEDCVDKDGDVLFEKLKPAHYCGTEYKKKRDDRDQVKFVASYETMEIDMIYDGPEAQGKGYPKVS